MSKKIQLIIGTIIAGFIAALSLIGLGSIYNLNVEIILYIMLIVIILVLAIVIMQCKLYKIEPINQEESIEAIEERDKWNSAKEQEDFFTLWAHQIKTPIAAMNLLLQSENQDVGLYKGELFKIEEYVETALNYLRFEGMSNDLRLERYSLEELVKQTVKKYRTIFINSHLSVKMENLDYNILTDEKWFQFILEQVLSNALKYTKEGGITFSGKIRDEELIISIKDTGIGIKKEDIPRLFEKGFTGYNGRMDKKASGLGLYLVKGVIDKLGHRIEIRSEEGVGTEVVITVMRERVKSTDLIND